MSFVFNDGGRAAAGFKGKAGDCVARAVAIAAQRPYGEVYDRLATGQGTQKRSSRKHARSNSRHGQRTAAHGVSTKRKWFKDYMAELGFAWTSTMQIGSGCKVHLRADELPAGRLIVAVSKHYCAVIDGVVHDTYRDDRDGTRCVYGYWRREA
jgi:hypothetical protein